MSKDKFDVCYSVIDNQQKVTVKATRKFTNNQAGFKELDAWIKKRVSQEIPLVFVVEATGVYYEQLAWHLFEQGVHVSVVLPNKAKKYFESLGLKSKNDKIDAGHPMLRAWPVWGPNKLWMPGNRCLLTSTSSEP